MDLQPVMFSAGTLFAIRDVAGVGWMALKPACEALGVDEEGQRQRLARQPWAVACVMQATGNDGKLYGMYCLRADRVAMWLATLQAGRVRPEIRPVLARWQCEAAAALDAWARGGTAPTTQGLTVEQVRTIVREELAALGVAAKGRHQSRQTTALPEAAVPALRALLAGWQRLCADAQADREGLTIREALDELTRHPVRHHALHAALAGLVAIHSPDYRGSLSVHVVGYIFRRYRNRVAEGLRLENRPVPNTHDRKWFVGPAEHLAPRASFSRTEAGR